MKDYCLQVYKGLLQALRYFWKTCSLSQTIPMQYSLVQLDLPASYEVHISISHCILYSKNIRLSQVMYFIYASILYYDKLFMMLCAWEMFWLPNWRPTDINARQYLSLQSKLAVILRCLNS